MDGVFRGGHRAGRKALERSGEARMRAIECEGRLGKTDSMLA